jgi:hypothetical protein
MNVGSSKFFAATQKNKSRCEGSQRLLFTKYMEDNLLQQIFIYQQFGIINGRSRRAANRVM